MLVILVVCIVFFKNEKIKAQQKNGISDSVIFDLPLCKYVILTSKSKPGPIIWDKIILKNIQKNILATNSNVPFFEFVINKKKINSLSPIWVMKNMVSRPMKNGGTEFTLIFNAEKEAAKGLELHWKIQFFAETALIRQQLTLIANEKNKYALNKLNNKLHFIFPQYALKIQSEINSTEELRIATWGKEVYDWDKTSTFDDRKWDGGAYFNLGQAHMFHPNRYHKALLKSGDSVSFKGPFGFVRTNLSQSMFAYEHASQDTPEGIMPHTEKTTSGSGNISIDDLQTSQSEYDITENDLRFFSINFQKTPQYIQASVEMNNGGYFDNELIDVNHPYQTIWFAFAPGISDNSKTIHDYLYYRISENTESRKTEFYYNTWGMQREMLGKKGNDIRSFVSYDNIFREIRLAAKMNLDLFVLDDGWEEAQGVWVSNKSRLTDGLKPIYDSLQKYKMKMGVWLSPQGIDSSTTRYRNHKEWVLIDKNKKPIPAQWGHPAFCMTSAFTDTLFNDCKKLIDQGVRFFKWDAINTFYFNPNMRLWSDEKATEKERNLRYSYLLPLYVTELMRKIYDYNPETVIEIDLTEAGRCCIGLAPLQYGKFFWMNNGASGYNDYSVHRSKSMRRIPEEFWNIIPPQLITYANYPHHVFPFFAQRNNVNSSLIMGNGFWGNLSSAGENSCIRAGEFVEKYKRILPSLLGQPMNKIEKNNQFTIFEQYGKNLSSGYIVGFASSAGNYTHSIKFNNDSVLAILHNSYNLTDNTISFQFSAPETSREVFVLPNNSSGMTILSSTCWLKDALIKDNNTLIYQTGSSGKQVIKIPKSKGKADILAEKKAKILIEDLDGDFVQIVIESDYPNQITIKPVK